MRIIIEDTNDDGCVDEKWIVEGDFTHILDLFKAFKRLTLAIGHSPENVENYFNDCENWVPSQGDEKWIQMWQDHAKKQENN